MPYLQSKDVWSTTAVIRNAFREWEEAVADGVGNGTITGEQAKLLKEKVLALVAMTDQKPEGEAEGGGSGSD